MPSAAETSLTPLGLRLTEDLTLFLDYQAGKINICGRYVAL